MAIKGRLTGCLTTRSCMPWSQVHYATADIQHERRRDSAPARSDTLHPPEVRRMADGAHRIRCFDRRPLRMRERVVTARHRRVRISSIMKESAATSGSKADTLRRSVIQARMLARDSAGTQWPRRPRWRERRRCCSRRARRPRRRGDVRFVGKTKYLNNAKAVVVHTIDDSTKLVVDTADAMDKYGIKGTFLISTEEDPPVEERFTTSCRSGCCGRGCRKR